MTLTDVEAPTEDNLMGRISPPPQIPSSPINVDRSTGAHRHSASPREHATQHLSDSQLAPSQAPKQGDSDEYHTAPRVSHVRILPTSLPYVHDQLMDQREKEQRRQARADAEEDKRESERKDVSTEEQEATARHLKPHSRSVVDLEKLRLEPPEGHAAPHQPKRSRKWQFGIRSRNQPYEAILYLYRAIEAQGGVWEIQPAEGG